MARQFKLSAKSMLEEASRLLINNATGKPSTKREMGGRIIGVIVNRTRAGRDKDGKVFASYKPRTVKQKRRKQQRIRPPSLTDTRSMLDNITIKRVDARQFQGISSAVVRKYVLGQIGFKSREMQRRALFHIEGTDNMAQRNFWGLTTSESRDLRKYWFQRVVTELPKGRKRTLRITIFAP